MADFTSAANWPQYATSSQVLAEDFLRVIRGVLVGKLIAVLQATPAAADITAAKAVMSDLPGWVVKVANLTAGSSVLSAKVANGTLAQADLGAGFQTAMWALVLQLAV